MRLRGIAVVLAALALGACDAGRLTGDVTRPRAQPGPRTSMDGSEYWTEAEYEAAGGANATEFAPECCTIGNFSSDMSSFTGRGAVDIRMLTDVSLTLDVQVRSNSNGASLNTGTDSYAYNGVVPLFEHKDLVATISTLNHTCGITGKARLHGNGGVRVIGNKDGAIITIWRKNIDASAPDKTVANCPPQQCPGVGGTSVAEGDGSQCYRDEDQPTDGGGGGDCTNCVDEPPRTGICRVRYWYWMDTNEVFDWTILWCA